MTAKSDFTEEEWELLTEAPATAGFAVAMAERGGSFRESVSLVKAYADARREPGEPELVDAVVASKPKPDRGEARSPEALLERAEQMLRDAVALVEQKATPEELEAYRRFVVAVAQRVAAAHKEGGQDVSPAEQSALDGITAALSAAPE